MPGFTNYSKMHFKSLLDIEESSFEIYNCFPDIEIFQEFKNSGRKLKMYFSPPSLLKGLQLQGFVFSQIKKNILSPWLLRKMTLYFFDYYSSWEKENNISKGEEKKKKTISIIPSLSSSLPSFNMVSTNKINGFGEDDILILYGKSMDLNSECVDPEKYTPYFFGTDLVDNTRSIWIPAGIVLMCTWNEMADFATKKFEGVVKNVKSRKYYAKYYSKKEGIPIINGVDPFDN
jgi:hypothetical protein